MRQCGSCGSAWKDTRVDTSAHRPAREPVSNPAAAVVLNWPQQSRGGRLWRIFTFAVTSETRPINRSYGEKDGFKIVLLSFCEVGPEVPDTDVLSPGIS